MSLRAEGKAGRRYPLRGSADWIRLQFAILRGAPGTVAKAKTPRNVLRRQLERTVVMVPSIGGDPVVEASRM